MWKILRQLFVTKPKQVKSANLKAHLNMTFKEELIDLDFNNVGTYHSGSRTKVKNDT